MNCWPKHDTMAITYPQIASFFCTVPQPGMGLVAAIKKLADLLRRGLCCPDYAWPLGLHYACLIQKYCKQHPVLTSYVVQKKGRADINRVVS